MATSPLQAAQHAAGEGSGDDTMHESADSDSAWGSVSDGLVGEEEMAGVEDLWMEHLQCVHTHGRHKCDPIELRCEARNVACCFTKLKDSKGAPQVP